MLFNKRIERGGHWGVENEEAKWAEFCAFIMKCRTIGLFKPWACANFIKIKIKFFKSEIHLIQQSFKPGGLPGASVRMKVWHSLSPQFKPDHGVPESFHHVELHLFVSVAFPQDLLCARYFIINSVNPRTTSMR